MGALRGTNRRGLLKPESLQKILVPRIGPDTIEHIVDCNGQQAWLASGVGVFQPLEPLIVIAEKEVEPSHLYGVAAQRFPNMRFQLGDQSSNTLLIILEVCDHGICYLNDLGVRHLNESNGQL